MTNRPSEYENLIKQRAFEEVQSTPGAVEQYLRNAENYLTSAKAVDPTLTLPMFTMAYEGYFQLVQAVLEHYQVRTKEAGRNLAIQRVSADLKLGPAEFSIVNSAHNRRNSTSYHSPFPPVSRQEAAMLVSILEKSIALAYQLTGTSALKPSSTATPKHP
jgi:hypothetical protein